jgi:hypothetical protein
MKNGRRTIARGRSSAPPLPGLAIQEGRASPGSRHSIIVIIVIIAMMRITTTMAVAMVRIIAAVTIAVVRVITAATVVMTRVILARPGSSLHLDLISQDAAIRLKDPLHLHPVPQRR